MAAKKEENGSPSVESLVKRGFIFLEDSDWDKADEYFDKALDANPEYAPAYIGKLCAELRVKREDSLGDYEEIRQGKKFDKPLGEYGNFQKALRFADDKYKKKLDAYEHTIKENFPKTIPQMFTDEFINGEIARLEKEIAVCDEKIAQNKRDWDFLNSNSKEIYDRMLVKETEYRDQTGDYSSKLSEIDRQLEKYDPLFKQYVEEVRSNFDGCSEANKRVNEYTKKKDGYEAEKKELEQLAGMSSCLDRMDEHYNRLAAAMKKKLTEGEYNDFAKQLRLLEGYKDSNQLADECEKLAIKAKFESFVQKKNKAKSVDEYKQLAKEFREMGGYENSSQLADECEKLAVKTKYDNLVREKNAASSVDKYENLARKFREMNGYENSAQLADECNKQVSVLKERIAEQRRQEEERKRKKAAEKEAEEARKEQQRKKEEAIKERKERIGLLSQLGIMFVFSVILFCIVANGVLYIEEAVAIICIASFVVSLACGVISLIFRRGAESKIINPLSLIFRRDKESKIIIPIPWGILIILLMSVILTVSTGVIAEDWSIVGSIISVLIPAVGVTYIILTGQSEDWGIWGYIKAFVLYAAIGGILGAIFNCSSASFSDSDGNYSMLLFILFTVLSIPGMIMISKAEKR